MPHHGVHLLTDDSGVRGLSVVGVQSASIDGAAFLVEGDRNLIASNHIGVDTDGNAAADNDYGVEVRGSDNVVGGTVPEDRNLIADNDVAVRVSSGRGNEITGNWVGTDGTGASGLGNSIGIVVASAGNIVGGSAPGAGNVIAESGQEGLELAGDGADQNVVQGNLIGTDAAGEAALPNRDGLDIEGGDDNLIGGPGPGEGNVVSGNAFDGIGIQANPDSSLSLRNRVEGNLIGTDARGDDPLPNSADAAPLGFGAGILVESDSGHNTLGGLGPGAGNLIAHNAGAGVIVWIGEDNAILGNSIFDNGGLGIDLTVDGEPTDNDAPSRPSAWSQPIAKGARAGPFPVAVAYSAPHGGSPRPPPLVT